MIRLAARRLFQKHVWSLMMEAQHRSLRMPFPVVHDLVVFGVGCCAAVHGASFSERAVMEKMWCSSCPSLRCAETLVFCCGGDDGGAAGARS